jgi:hypothetical protein
MFKHSIKISRLTLESEINIAASYTEILALIPISLNDFNKILLKQTVPISQKIKKLMAIYYKLYYENYPIFEEYICSFIHTLNVEFDLFTKLFSK